MHSSPDLRSLVSALTSGQLAVSEASYGFDAEGGAAAFRSALVELRDLDVQTSLGRLRAAVIELTNVTVRLGAHTASGDADRGPALTIEQVRVKDASIDPLRVRLDRAASPGPRWQLEPIASLDGTLHAAIVDAAWIFDADVTIPIADGRIDFNRATVEHVGPDSSMGMSRTGVYVDAPNGRTYLYRLSATDLPGARFEQRRGGLLPGWSGDRGSLELRPFLEGILSGAQPGSLASGTRDMLSRTRLSGEFGLGDGVVGDERRRAVLVGGEHGRNHVQLSMLAPAPGIVLRMPELSVGDVRCELGAGDLAVRALEGTVSVQLRNDAGGPGVSVSVADLTLRDLTLL